MDKERWNLHDRQAAECIPAERHLAALPWLLGSLLAARYFSRKDVEVGPFTAFQARQARCFYAAVLAIGLAVTLLLLVLFGGLMFISMLVVVLGMLEPEGNLGLLPGVAMLLFLGAPWLYFVVAFGILLLIVGGGRLAGFIVGLLVWQGRNVRLPYCARRAGRIA